MEQSEGSRRGLLKKLRFRDDTKSARRMLDAGAVSMIQFEFGPANIYSRTFFYDFRTLLSGAYDIDRIVPNGLAHIACYGEHREIFLTTNYLAVRRAG